MRQRLVAALLLILGAPSVLAQFGDWGMGGHGGDSAVSQWWRENRRHKRDELRAEFDREVAGITAAPDRRTLDRLHDLISDAETLDEDYGGNRPNGPGTCTRLERLANWGDARSQFELGQITFPDSSDSNYHPEASHRWLALAAAQDYPRASERLARLEFETERVNVDRACAALPRSGAPRPQIAIEPPPRVAASVAAAPPAPPAPGEVTALAQRLIALQTAACAQADECAWPGYEDCHLRLGAFGSVDSAWWLGHYYDPTIPLQPPGPLFKPGDMRPGDSLYDGFEQDARAWYQRAALQGDERARAALAELDRRRAASR
jgi:hypothetical protein